MSYLTIHGALDDNGISYADMVKYLNDQGIKCNTDELSKTARGKLSTPKADRIKKACWNFINGGCCLKSQ